MAKILEEHYGYLSDSVKIARYQAAITKLIQPGHVVLDLGCGSGLLGLMALRAGAERVLFVEEGPIIEVARQTIRSAGYADRAEYFQTNSYELQLSEKVDIVVCDHVGYFGFDYGLLELLADAKRRFLKADGTIIPQGLDLRLAPIESQSCADIVNQWTDGRVPDDFSWLGSIGANTKHSVNLEATDLISTDKSLTTLRLGDEVPPFLTWRCEFLASRDATFSGIAGWFECALTNSIMMTNSPCADEALDRPQAFLPLEESVNVKSGDAIHVTVMIRPLDSIIAWVVDVPGSNKQFSQTTFSGLFLGSAALTANQPEKLATLNAHGKAHQVVLSYCDGTRTVADVQKIVKRKHADLFPTEQAIDAFVARILTWDVLQ